MCISQGTGTVSLSLNEMCIRVSALGAGESHGRVDSWKVMFCML